MIQIEHLRKEYANVTPLKDVSAVINDGDVISVIGPSGTGKSTLIRCLNMLETPTSGKIYVDGEDITQKGCRLDLVRRKMGMVFQSFNLFGHLTVIENIMLAPMDLMGKSKQEAYDKGMELLEMVGLSSKALNYPDELSGGQKQRVAIARALAMDPKILLFDEPTSALDPNMVGEVMKVILDLAGKGITMIIVTHEMQFARNVANRVFYMDQGEIYEKGTPEEIFEHPKKKYTRRFIQQLKVFSCDIKERPFDFPGAVSQICDFCMKQMICNQMMQRLLLIFEEIVMQLLLPHLDEKDEINFLAEYSTKINIFMVTVKYGSVPYNPATDEDDLSWKIVSGISSKYQWVETPHEILRNQITLTFGEGRISSC